MSKFLHDAAANKINYLDVFFENSPAKKGYVNSEKAWIISGTTSILRVAIPLSC